MASESNYCSKCGEENPGKESSVDNSRISLISNALPGSKLISTTFHLFVGLLAIVWVPFTLIVGTVTLSDIIGVILPVPNILGILFGASTLLIIFYVFFRQSEDSERLRIWGILMMAIVGAITNGLADIAFGSVAAAGTILLIVVSTAIHRSVIS